LLIVAVVLVALGLAGVVLSAVWTASAAGRLEQSAGTFDAPGSARLILDRGTWVVAASPDLAVPGASVSGGSFSSGPAPQVVPAADVSVTGPSGTSVALSPSPSQVVFVGGQIYVGVVEFDVPRPGPYRVAIHGTSGSAVVARPVLQALESLLPGIGAMVGSGLVGVVGVVLLIVALVRRARSRGPVWANAPVGPPPTMGR
jgi:hypothetical protein